MQRKLVAKQYLKDSRLKTNQAFSFSEKTFRTPKIVFKLVNLNHLQYLTIIAGDLEPAIVFQGPLQKIKNIS